VASERTAVAVHGASGLAERVRRAIAAQADMAVAGAGTVHVLVDGEAPDGPAVRVGCARPPVRHSAWGALPGPSGGPPGVPDAPTCAVLRPLRAIPDVIEVHVVRLAPGGERGPIDALVPGPDGDGPPWPPGARWAQQTVTAPQTRCWLLACAVRARRALDRPALLAALAAAPRVLVVSRRAGFADTGVLCEFFRDAGRPGGEFFETVVFADSVATDGASAWFWAAAEDGAAAAEAVDAVRALCRPDLAAAEVAAATDRALGLAGVSAAAGALP
jgi:hypothetical protein